MTVYYMREGKMVEAASLEEARNDKRSVFPSPMVSRFEAFESLVTGQSISSWRQRDRDMQAVDAVDRRDIPKKTFEKRKQIVERNGRADKSS